MKLTTFTPLLFTTLALASPAPAAHPAAAPAVQPLAPHDQLGALAARLSAIVPDIRPRASGGKSSGSSDSSGSTTTVKPKVPKGGSNSTDSTNAAVSLSPSTALQFGVFGLVAVEALMQMN
jgi:hypothetical protein